MLRTWCACACLADELVGLVRSNMDAVSCLADEPVCLALADACASVSCVSRCAFRQQHGCTHVD
eukprot:1287737-Alexandrium_andersonii.AAC.1